MRGAHCREPIGPGALACSLLLLSIPLGSLLLTVMAAKFMAKMAEVRQLTWNGLLVSHRTALSKGAKLCTCHHWSGCPSKICCEPYYELPMSITRLSALVQIRVGSYALPIQSFKGQPIQSSCSEQGRFVRPSLPRHLRPCNPCSIRAVGDELDCPYYCSHFRFIRAQYGQLISGR